MWAGGGAGVRPGNARAQGGHWGGTQVTGERGILAMRDTTHDTKDETGFPLFGDFQTCADKLVQDLAKIKNNEFAFGTPCTSLLAQV